MTSEDVFLGGGNEYGNYIKANIPNIKGAIEAPISTYVMEATPWSDPGGMFNPTGAFYRVQRGVMTRWNASGENGSQLRHDVLFDANKFNQIYNNKNRLNPNYYNVEWWIKYK